MYGEEALFRFAADAPVFYPNEGKTFFSHNEQHYKPVNLSQIPAGEMATLPAVVATAVGPRVAIAEADVESYPGLWLRATGGPALAAAFPPYPLEEKAARDRDVKVVRAADYIAVTTGTRAYPWRVLGIAANDGDLITNALVYLLQRPSELADTSWIKPGKVAWDWWNDRNLTGVDFKPGMNTQTYKFFVDFAARVRHRVHHPRRGLVQDRQPAAGRARPRHAGAARLRARQERRRHPVGGVEDAGRPVRARAGAVPGVGHQGR